MNRSIIILALFISSFSIFAQYSVAESSKYICPPCNSACDEIEHENPGVCAHCNMVLIQKNMTKTIAFYLQDGVEVLDFAGPMEVFAYAGYKVFTVSETKAPIKSQGILTVTPDYSIEDAPAADILAFFGGNSNAASQNSKVIEWVKRQSEVQYHFSVCTGAFVLAEAGILDGKTATTFHSALDDLESNYPKINVRKDTRFVDNGRVITTAGVSAGIDGALHLVAKLQGINAAKRTAYYMEYDNWKIGDGLLLTDDNPYLPKESPDFYKAFEGRYEYKDNQQLELAFVNGDLHALINGVHYPIYHEEDSIFSDVDGKRIFFKREGSKQVLGYTLEEDGPLYKKL